MFFRQVYEEGLAQASYVLGCQENGEAMVVNPKRDVDTYLELAAAQDLRIVGVAETHVHADYLCGARELAAATGATLYLSDEGDADWKYRGLEGFKHVLLKDGDEIRLGNVRLKALHTPGHTPEHLSFLVTDGASSNQPGIALTGDFVFVGDLGRPDLLEEAVGVVGSAQIGAQQMFESLRQQFLSLPDYVQVWPGHGAGSACGKALGAAPNTTVGYERRFAWWAGHLQKGGREQFGKALLQGQPEAPTYFTRMKRLNRDGMPVLGSLPAPQRLGSRELQQLRAEGALLVDTRTKTAFAEGHLAGAINIPAGRSFSTWAGWLLPEEKPLVLLAEAGQVEDLMRKLVRVGLDRTVGYVTAPLKGDLEPVPQITAEAAKGRWEPGEALLLDVPSGEEYDGGHIPGALNLYAGRVMRRLDRVPQDQPVILRRTAGDRSSIAISALMAAGRNLLNLAGGLREWQQQGFPIEKSTENVGV